MAKKKAGSDTGAATITPERAARLCRLLKLLGQGPQNCAVLTRRLRLGIRRFYRDLEFLAKKADILVELADGKYYLREDAAAALERLPFPDPALTLGDARLLARGRSKAHKKIREQLVKIDR